jgi:ornithine cyclodeaminase/alanine dehydrogenase-like protein (mu-crystallin family)
MPENDSSTLIISQAEVPALLPMDACIAIMEGVFRALARGETLLPLRQVMEPPERNGLLAMMPAYVNMSDSRSMGLKAISVFPDNKNTPYDTHQGVVLLFEIRNGRLLAILDATSITAIRTAAVSALATKLLARADATDLALLGSGTQARTHLEAMQRVRPLRRVRVWSPHRENVDHFAKRETARMGMKIEPMPTAQAAVSGADLICTVTSAREAVLYGEWIRPGCHINAVGACTPAARELDTTAVVRSKLFVDRRESTLNEAGDFLIPQHEGRIDETHILGEIGELLTDRVSGRQSGRDITLFKSLGLAVEDLAAAWFIYTQALAQGRGRQIQIGGFRID